MTYTWNDFVRECRQCTKCDLSKTRLNTVVYRGSIQAPLMFVGEGPGATEDELGLPFVGQAGQLLDLLIHANGFSEKDYHICNIVKCRPPENRVPTPEEAKLCMPLLGKQIRLSSPKVIVLLGATAYKYFTQKQDPISKIRGQWIEKNGYYIMPTFHPAYILRNNRERIKLWTDIRAVSLKLQELGLLSVESEVPIMPEGRKRIDDNFV